MTKKSGSRGKRPTIQSLLAKLRPFVVEAAKGSTGAVGIYGCSLRAAVAKSFEFAMLANNKKPPKHGFFITATLRGICEDLIIFTFLDGLSPDDREEAVSLTMARQLAEGVAAQGTLFAKLRPWQPILKPTDFRPGNTDKEIKTLALKLGWNLRGKQSLPSVRFMAEKASLIPVYDYFYSATSKWVHFSPHVLLRMGWGGNLMQGVGPDTEWVFSTSNFGPYYKEFNQVNSVYLLLRILHGPAKGLLPQKANAVLKQLQSEMDEVLRWPEVVTFEELNVNPPGPLMRILMKVSHKRQAAENSKQPKALNR